MPRDYDDIRFSFLPGHELLSSYRRLRFNIADEMTAGRAKSEYRTAPIIDSFIRRLESLDDFLLAIPRDDAFYFMGQAPGNFLLLPWPMCFAVY